MPPDKRRKIGSARSAGVATVGRGRQPLAAVNNRQDVVASASDMGGAEGLECERVEFTKEEVEALLNEKVKGKKFDVKVWFLLVCFSLGYFCAFHFAYSET